MGQDFKPNSDMAGPVVELSEATPAVAVRITNEEVCTRAPSRAPPTDAPLEIPFF
jgi:hypothetical protein